MLTVDGEPGNENIIVNMTLLTTGAFLQRDDMIERFLTSINGLGVVTAENIVEKHIKGSFYFPQHSIHKYVFADLVLNDQIFSSMMSIDESQKATNKKESIYIHFHNSKIGKLTANITEKISTRNDSDLRGKDVNGAFKFGTTYIRIKIVKAENIEAVVAFQDTFSKFLSLYDKKYDEIITFYKKYITDFGKSEKDTSKTAKPGVIGPKLKDIAPEVFVAGYPTKCTHAPTIINDEEVIEEAKKDETDKTKRQVMRYPNDSELFRPRNYICKYTDYKYPGLHENTFEKNNDIVPYLPCCFKKDNSKRGSNNNYCEYFYGEEKKDKSTANQQDLITTKKFVSADKYGTLPANLNKMFDIFDYNEEFVYVRKGVHDANSSFLECVLEGMYETTDILEHTEDRKEYLTKLRCELANEANAAACRQEMYDYSIEQIIETIRDPSLYMEPSLFTSFLEQHFKCNIFVFSRSVNNANLTIPRHLHAYYKNKREANCVFIYEHTGSQADKQKGKRCELIVKWRKTKKDDVRYFYEYDSDISKGVRDVYNSMKQVYILKDEIQESSITINRNKRFTFEEQGFDSYGKCRMLRFAFDSEKVTILTDPLQPFIVKEARNWIATKTSKDTAIKLATILKIKLTSQCVRGGHLKELYGNFGDVKVTIPVNDNSIPEEGLEEENDRIINPTSESSALASYNKYKKLARYIVEYMFWLFSHYLEETGKIPSLDTINDFIKDKIKINPLFEYGKVSEIFSENNGVMKDDKLIVKSEETLKRLIYTLRLSLLRFREKIETYHKRKTIEHFYVDVTDFDQYPRQVLLYGENSLENWNKEKNNKDNIYNSIPIGLETPYFFKNDHIKPDVVYLAQNANTLQKAMEIGETWATSGFNIDGNASGDKNISLQFELYRYINSQDIVLYNVLGDPTSFKIRVLGWKSEGISSFAVLLPL